MAAAFGTFGGGGTVAELRAGDACLAGPVPAAATLRETMSVVAPTNVAATSSARCFTLVHPFLRPQRVWTPLHTSRLPPFGAALQLRRPRFTRVRRCLSDSRARGPVSRLTEPSGAGSPSCAAATHATR